MWVAEDGAGAHDHGDMRLAVVERTGGEIEEAAKSVPVNDGSRRQEGLQQKHTDPRTVFGGGAERTEGTRSEPARGEEQGDLPEGVGEIGKKNGFQRSHEFFASSLKRCVSLARRLASIWPSLSRLITSSSLEPPNIRSMRSRTPWPRALASVTRAE